MEMVLFPKNNFSALVLRFFGKKTGKTLNVGKIRKYDEEIVLFREKMFSSSWKPILNKNVKAQNMPKVAGRHVFNLIKLNTYESSLQTIHDHELFRDRGAETWILMDESWKSFESWIIMHDNVH